MAETHYKLLAGPILRRAEAASICIWVATKDAVTVTGRIFIAADTLQKASPRIIGLGKAPSIQLGKSLHITLIQIVPVKDSKNPTPLFGMSLYAYDLDFAFKDKSQGKKLSDCFDSIWGENGIAYPPYALPTFFLKNSGQANILHGSCRKLHGDGMDALSIGDAVIRNNLNDPGARPNALFLTGDQIYADDVGDPLIDRIINFGKELLGWEEAIPATIGGKDLPLKILHCGDRARLIAGAVTRDGKPLLSSTEARNHLLGFGDFAAMYLLAWNQENWEELPKNSPCKNIKADKYQQQLQNLENTRKTLPSVRRLLANIPTYMIFDDHEITDDWNISLDWKKRVEGNPAGRRILSNGLAAYWAFQAWGNDPESFSKEFYGSLLSYLQSEGTTGSTDFEEGFLSFASWDFVSPTWPNAIFLNARTLRGFNEKYPMGPPELLGKDALEKLTGRLKQVITGSQSNPLLVIAPAPVIGIRRIEEMQEWYGKSMDPTTFDLESWHANQDGYYKFLSAIHNSGISSCIFLSGDVHYSFAMTNHFELNRKSTRFIQFTSSAFKNETHGVGAAVLDKLKNASPRKARLCAWLTISPTLSKKIKLFLISRFSPLANLNPLVNLSSLIWTINFMESHVVLPEQIVNNLHISELPDLYENLEMLSTANNTQDPFFLPFSSMGQLIINDDRARMIFHAVKGDTVSHDEIPVSLNI